MRVRLQSKLMLNPGQIFFILKMRAVLVGMTRQACLLTDGQKISFRGAIVVGRCGYLLCSSSLEMVTDIRHLRPVALHALDVHQIGCLPYVNESVSFTKPCCMTNLALRIVILLLVNQGLPR